MRSYNAGRISFFAIVLLFSIALTGCKKEEPNPESLDPIYADLSRRASEAQKNLDEEAKKMAAAKAAEEKAEPNSIELKNAQRDYLKSQHTSLDLEQMAKYYTIRSNRRLYVDRISYKAALAKNQPWPDPHEYSDYLVNMRLQESPRNWSSHVPKLQERLSKTPVVAKKSEKKEGKSEE
jgi:hypothetical protein